MRISTRHARTIRAGIDSARRKVAHNRPFVETFEDTPNLWERAFMRTRDRYLGAQHPTAGSPVTLPRVPAAAHHEIEGTK